MKKARKCSGSIESRGGSLKELEKLEKSIKKSMKKMIEIVFSEAFNTLKQELRRLKSIS